MLVSGGSADLVSLFERELQLCNLKEGETVAILSQGDERHDYADAFMVAATELKACAFSINLPASALNAALGRPSNPLVDSRVAVDALKACDLVIDLIGLLWTKEQRDIEAHGARMLMCVGKADTLIRMFPTRVQKERVLNAERLLRESHQLRIVSDEGTDLTYQLGKYPVLTQYGFVQDRGRWDHFVSTLVAVVAQDGSAEGRLVLAPGDIAFPFDRYLTEKVEFQISEGEVKVLSGASEATFIRDYMESFHDKRAYSLSHVGWGLNENARWSGLALGAIGEARSVLGSVMFSTGPNTEFGGDNDTACHLDFPMRKRSLYLDDRLVIDNGSIVVDL